jgi:hypothetical protein
LYHDSSSNNLNSLVFSPDSNPYGVAYAEWVARWWQWALSIPAEKNPVTDTTGENSTINQSGPVWFLAGTLGGVVDRTCTIPAEKAILLPILNYGGTLIDSQSEEELLAYATQEMDIDINLDIVVDSLKLNDLRRYRVRSPIFDVVLPENNLFGGRPGPTRGASDGFWLFLQPLTKGKHKIHSFGSCLAGKIRIGVNYDITTV